MDMMDIIGPLKAQIHEQRLWNQILWLAFVIAIIAVAVLGYTLKVEKDYSQYLEKNLEKKRAKKYPKPEPKSEPSPTSKWLDEAVTTFEKSELRVDLNIFDLREVLNLLISKQLIKP